MQHNNARLSFCSFVTHFRDTETQRHRQECSINSIDMILSHLQCVLLEEFMLKKNLNRCLNANLSKRL